MFKLVKLEASKFGLLREMIVTLLVTFAISLMVYFIAKDEGISYNHVGLYQLIKLFTSSAFFVFGGGLVSKHFIGEYDKNTIKVLFSYPVSRKKIMLSKAIFISLFTLSVTVMSYLFSVFIFKVLGTLSGLTMDSLTLEFVFNSSKSLLIDILKLNTMHAVTLFVGFKLKSSTAVMVSSIMLMLVVFKLTRLGMSILFTYMPVLIGGIGLIALLFILSTIDEVDLT